VLPYSSGLRPSECPGCLGLRSTAFVAVVLASMLREQA
jgi:hypothetical protein